MGPTGMETRLWTGCEGVEVSFNGCEEICGVFLGLGEET